MAIRWLVLFLVASLGGLSLAELSKIGTVQDWPLSGAIDSITEAENGDVYLLGAFHPNEKSKSLISVSPAGEIRRLSQTLRDQTRVNRVIERNPEGFLILASRSEGMQRTTVVKLSENGSPDDSANGDLICLEETCSANAIDAGRAPDGSLYVLTKNSAFGLEVLKFGRDYRPDLRFKPAMQPNNVNRLLVQPDGKIALFGIEAMRYESSGELDSSFQPDLGGTTSQVRLRSEGRFLAVVTRPLAPGDFPPNHNPGSGRKILYRSLYLPELSLISITRDGKPDPTFDPEGIQKTKSPLSLVQVYALHELSNGQIVIVGSVSKKRLLARATASGIKPSPRVIFLDSRGRFIRDFSPGEKGEILSIEAASIDNGGDIHLAYRNEPRPSAIEIAAFSPEGRRRWQRSIHLGERDKITRVDALPDGELLLIHEEESVKVQPLPLVRIRNGQLDRPFLETIQKAALPKVEQVLVQSDTRLTLLLNSALSSSTSSIVRLNNDGTPDATFRSEIRGNVTRLVPDSQGRILALGKIRTGEPPAPKKTQWLVRLLPSGRLDPEYRVQTPWFIRTATDGARCKDGKTVLAVDIAQGLVRVDRDGSDDPSLRIESSERIEIRQLHVGPDDAITVLGQIPITEKKGTWLTDVWNMVRRTQMAASYLFSSSQMRHADFNTPEFRWSILAEILAGKHYGYTAKFARTGTATLARFDRQGRLDSAFVDNSHRVLASSEFAPQSLAVADDHSIYLVGTFPRQNTPSLLHLSKEGRPDTQFPRLVLGAGTQLAANDASGLWFSGTFVSQGKLYALQRLSLNGQRASHFLNENLW